jgi:hypothetical protein
MSDDAMEAYEFALDLSATKARISDRFAAWYIAAGYLPGVIAERDRLLAEHNDLTTTREILRCVTEQRDRLLFERDELRAALKEAIDLAKNIPLGGDGWQARHVRLAEAMIKCGWRLA